jgi:hypothetical protein
MFAHNTTYLVEETPFSNLHYSELTDFGNIFRSSRLKADFSALFVDCMGVIIGLTLLKKNFD